MASLNEIISKLDNYWKSKGCLILQPYCQDLGAATLHPATMFGVLGNKESYNVAYAQPVVRPCDGRYGMILNRLYKYHQYQVILQPFPSNVQDLYLDSLKEFGITQSESDIRFVEDNWENPSVGAAGIGWEIWCDGAEISQFTYMHQLGGCQCEVIACELTYGVERIAMHLQRVDNILDILIDDNGTKYSDLYASSEYQFSTASLDLYKKDSLMELFNIYEQFCNSYLEEKLYLVAYDFCIKASHILNLLEARKFIGVSERALYILKLRSLSKKCCEQHIEKQKLNGVV